MIEHSFFALLPCILAFYFFDLGVIVRESTYQAGLIKKLRRLYPDAIIMKNDSGYIQGIPDLTILHEDRWATLEVKAKPPTSSQAFEPNQEWFIDKMNDMSFSACIYPENEKDVLRGLQQALAPGR